MSKPLFEKVLVANRGEIALRIMRTLRKMGIISVAIYSEADTNSNHVQYADEAYFIGNSPATESYLSIKNIVNAIRISGATAVHPGYGFLAENSQFANILKREGIESLQKRLRDHSPELFEKTEIQNPQRLIRTIEVAEGTVIKKTDIPEFKFPFELEAIVMEMDREKLYDRINRRVDQMVLSGLEEEAKAFYELRHLNALQTVGYSEWWPYFEGEYSRDTAIDKIKQHSRNYAKRQITWFKNQL